MVMIMMMMGEDGYLQSLSQFTDSIGVNARVQPKTN